MIGDCLLVGYNYSAGEPILTVGRNESENFRILNTIRGDAAFGIYEYLKGNAFIRHNEKTNEIVFQLKCIKEHLKFVSQTTDKSVDFDIQVLDGCISQLEAETL